MEYFIFIAWSICCVVAYGVAFASNQRQYPSVARSDYSYDRRYSLFISFGGPITLVIYGVYERFKYGIKYED